ncbi:hypothetical protein ACFW95_00900 [Streptomyces sp. NPDC059474]|uniref:hypothetical protein n=1 Tax=unclassified Streptomyces TaxID=2593676 RepID=UPI0033EB9C4F
MAAPLRMPRLLRKGPGEAAILCFGQVRRTPWEHKGRVRLRDIARFLERPELMVLHQ